MIPRKDDAGSFSGSGPSKYYQLLSLGSEEKWRLVLGFALSAASSLLSLVFPKAIGIILDFAIATASLKDTTNPTLNPSSLPFQFSDKVPSIFHGLENMGFSMSSMAAVLIAVVTLQAFINVARERCLTTAGENISADLRIRTLSNVLTQELAFFDQQVSIYGFDNAFCRFQFLRPLFQGDGRIGSSNFLRYRTHPGRSDTFFSIGESRLSLN